MRNWTETLYLGDVWRNQTMPFPERRDAIVSRIKASRWYRRDESGELADVVDELSLASTAYRFDVAWDHLYDLADEGGVWIDIWSSAAVAP